MALDRVYKVLTSPTHVSRHKRGTNMTKKNWQGQHIEKGREVRPLCLVVVCSVVDELRVLVVLATLVLV